MILRLIKIYAIILSLNSVIRANSWAALDTTNWHNSLTEPQRPLTFVANDKNYKTWPPAVQTQNWLITTSADNPISINSPSLGEREQFSLMLPQHRQAQVSQQQYPSNRYYSYNLERNGNYTKKQITSLSGATSTSPSSAVSNHDDHRVTLKLKPFKAAPSDNLNTNNNRRYNAKRRHLDDYPYARDISNMASQAAAATQPERLMPDTRRHFWTDVNRHLQQDNLLSAAQIDNRLSQIPVAKATATSTKNTLTPRDENLRDTSAPAPNSSPNINVLKDENIYEILLTLQVALDKVKQFCDIVKDIITDDKDNRKNGEDTDGVATAAVDDEGVARHLTPAAAATNDDGAEDLSNEDGNNDNDLTKSNFAPVLAPAKVMLKKKHVTTSSSLYSIPVAMEEGQGQRNEIYGVRGENSLTPTILPAAAKSSASSSELITSRSFSGKSERLNRPPFEDSARKHKIKKKFKKMLFPLLLAYKLKFMALIPLLIGGLTLLVGSTGLAGFFFALFAAVMTMKGGHGHGKSL